MLIAFHAILCVMLSHYVATLLCCHVIMVYCYIMLGLTVLYHIMSHYDTLCCITAPSVHTSKCSWTLNPKSQWSGQHLAGQPAAISVTVWVNGGTRQIVKRYINTAIYHFAILCHAIFMPCYIMLCHVLSFHVILLCYCMSCRVTFCYKSILSTLCYVISCCVILCVFLQIKTTSGLFSHPTLCVLFHSHIGHGLWALQGAEKSFCWSLNFHHSMQASATNSAFGQLWSHICSQRTGFIDWQIDSSCYVQEAELVTSLLSRII